MNKNIDQIIDLGLSGALLAIFVLFLFLRKIRIISIVAFAIPISVFSSFYFFYLFGITINTLTLTGIALAVGMLLDNSIVVMENIYRLKGVGSFHRRGLCSGNYRSVESNHGGHGHHDYRVPAFPFRGQLFGQADRGTHRNLYRGNTYHIAGRGLAVDTDGGKRYFAQDSEDVNFSNLSIHNRLVQIYVAILKMSLRRPAQVIIIALVTLLVTVVLSTSLTLNTLKEVELNTFNVYITPRQATRSKEPTR